HLLYFTLLALIVSCGKEKQKQLPTKVTGNVINASTDSALVNLVVSLTENELFNTPGSEISTSTTDANGNFSFSFEADPDKYYHVIIRSNNNSGYTFLSSWNPGGGPFFTQKEIEAGENNIANLNPATDGAWVFNINGDSGADSMEVFVVHDQMSYFNVSGAWFYAGSSEQLGGTAAC